ncbi:hypothetical protein JCM10296v2_006687 [Rhodotorula toruloides]
MPHTKVPSLKPYLSEPLGKLMSALNRADSEVGFSGSKPSNSFRKGFIKVLNDAWWAARIAHEEGYAGARAIRGRLEADAGRVEDEWRRRTDGHGIRSQALVAFCETLLGEAVYEHLKARDRSDEETQCMMFECGEVYAALLKSLALPHEGMRAPGDYTYFDGKPQSHTFEGAPVSTLESLSHDHSMLFFPVSRRLAQRC